MALPALIIAKRYALALLEGALPASHMQIIEELKFFQKIVEDDPALQKLIPNEYIESNIKQQVITMIFADSKFLPEVERFITLLLNNNRLNLVPAVIEYMQSEMNVLHNIMPLTLFSAAILSKKKVEEMRLKLCDYFKKDIILEYLHEPKLLGGIKIEGSSLYFDASVENLLNKLQRELLETGIMEFKSKKREKTI